MTTRLESYRIYTSNNGLSLVVEEVYKAVCSRAQHMFTRLMSLPLFVYVVNLAWLARLVEVNIQACRNIPHDTFTLCNTMRGVCLPDTICRYIETLGIIDLACGIRVIPYVDSYRQLIPMASPWYLDPLEQLEELHIPDPQCEWSIIPSVVARYTEASAQFFRCGVELRTISREVTGLPELVIGYSSAESLVIPISPERHTISCAQLGAAYRLRDYGQRDEWPFGENEVLPNLFNSEAISPELVLAQTVISRMVR